MYFDPATGREMAGMNCLTWGFLVAGPQIQKDSCNLMWTAERPRSLELKQEDLDRIKTSKQRTPP